MWTIIKIDKSKFKLLKKDFEKKTGEEFIFYKPKIKVEKYIKNKLSEKEFDLLGNYVFCYNTSFKEKKTINLLRFSIGLKYFLQGFLHLQEDITKFVNKCKKLENIDGTISASFIEGEENKTYEFLSGPFANRLFTILELKKDKLKILLGAVESYIDKKKYLFRST